MGKTYDFDTPVMRRGTVSVKWDKGAIQNICGNSEADPFWVADMDLHSPEEVRTALAEASSLGVYGYPEFTGNEELFVAWAKKRHGWDITPAQVSICQGMLGSISLLTEILTKDTDGIIVPLPAYQPFLRLVKNYGRKLAPWHLSYDSETAKFSLDFEELERLCAEPDNTMLVFCSPHNPAGIVWDREVLLKIARIAAKHDVTVVSDEIHSDLAFEGEQHVPFNVVAKEAGCKAVTCMAPSKTFNIAGEHFSIAVFDDLELKKAFAKRQEQLFATEPSLLSGTAARAGYTYGYDWLMQLRRYLKDNVNYIDAFCKDRIPQIKVVVPHASFICFMDCGDLLPLVEMDAAKHPELYDAGNSPSGGLMSRFFGLRAEIAVNDGTWFGGEDFKRFIRFNYGTSRSVIEQALLKIEAAVKALQ